MVSTMSRNVFETQLLPGQLLARGVCRHLRNYDFVSVEELVPTSGLRVDVMALGPKGEIWVIECKSSRADFQADHKWQGYLEWCDRFFWAVDSNFPTELLPDESGLIIADGYDAEIIIWIVKRFRDEHRQAIDWLNENTKSKINFFGIKIELWQIDDSKIAPKFNIISQPNEWTKVLKESISANGLSNSISK